MGRKIDTCHEMREDVQMIDNALVLGNYMIFGDIKVFIRFGEPSRGSTDYLKSERKQDAN